MATRLTPALAIVAIVAAACGGAIATPAPLASDAATAVTAEPAVTYPRPAPLADLPLVELVGPAMLNAGPAPVFEWQAVEGAATYRLSVRGPDGYAWAWQGTETAIRYGAVAEAQQGPTIVPGTTWSVAALAGDASLVAMSERRLVSPTDDRGPTPDGMAAVGPAASAAATPEAATPVATGPCSLLTGDEISAAIEGTWGPPDEEAATGVQGICTWTSANGTPLTLYVAPADQYDPDGWGADETLSGLGDQAYRVTKGWDRRVGFVSGDASVMLTIDYTKVDAEGFVDLARLVESRLP